MNFKDITMLYALGWFSGMMTALGIFVLIYRCGTTIQ